MAHNLLDGLTFCLQINSGNHCLGVIFARFYFEYWFSLMIKLIEIKTSMKIFFDNIIIAEDNDYICSTKWTIASTCGTSTT